MTRPFYNTLHAYEKCAIDGYMHKHSDSIGVNAAYINRNRVTNGDLKLTIEQLREMVLMFSGIDNVIAHLHESHDPMLERCNFHFKVTNPLNKTARKNARLAQ